MNPGEFPNYDFGDRNSRPWLNWDREPFCQHVVLGIVLRAALEQPTTDVEHGIVISTAQFLEVRGVFGKSLVEIADAVLLAWPEP